MRLVTVLANKDTCSIFLTATSPRCSPKRSLVEGKINSSPIVNRFFASAIRLATKYDAFSAFSFIDVIALRNFFSSSWSLFFQNTPRDCLLFQGACCSSGKIVFDGFIASLESRLQQTMQSGVDMWESPVAINAYSSMTHGIVS